MCQQGTRKVGGEASLTPSNPRGGSLQRRPATAPVDNTAALMLLALLAFNINVLWNPAEFCAEMITCSSSAPKPALPRACFTLVHFTPSFLATKTLEDVFDSSLYYAPCWRGQCVLLALPSDYNQNFTISQQSHFAHGQGHLDMF